MESEFLGDMHIYTLCPKYLQSFLCRSLRGVALSYIVTTNCSLLHVYMYVQFRTKILIFKRAKIPRKIKKSEFSGAKQIVTLCP